MLCRRVIVATTNPLFFFLFFLYIVFLASTKARAGSSEGSSRDTVDDIGRLSDVFCTSPDTPSCDSAYTGTFKKKKNEKKRRKKKEFLSKILSYIRWKDQKNVIYVNENNSVGLDDSCVDDVLADGIHGQDLVDNDCYKEIQSQIDLKVAASNVIFRKINIDEVVKALIRDNASLSDKMRKFLQQYQVRWSRV